MHYTHATGDRPAILTEHAPRVPRREKQSLPAIRTCTPNPVGIPYARPVTRISLVGTYTAALNGMRLFPCTPFWQNKRTANSLRPNA